MSLRALTENQERYIKSIKSHTITFGVGCAGTGKSYIAATMACDAFLEKRIQNIIITRPMVQAGAGLGFLKGDLQEKFTPFMTPLTDIMSQAMGASQFAYAIKSKKIQMVPLELMRGSSWNDSWVILDEAQNATKQQMLMFLTRIGRNTKAIVDGDPDQCDLKVESGLNDALVRLRDMPDVAIIKFYTDDIVRSGVVRDVLVRYAGG
jgi:phosphate starvation-inducible PhoH-like protein